MAKSPRCSRNITLLNPSRPRPGRSAARQVNPPCPRLLVAGACTSWRSLAVHLVRMGGIKRPGEPGADEVGLVESTSQGTSKRLRQSPPTSPCTGAQPAGVCPICRCLLVQKCERVALARLPPPAPRSLARAPVPPACTIAPASDRQPVQEHGDASLAVHAQLRRLRLRLPRALRLTLAAQAERVPGP